MRAALVGLTIASLLVVQAPAHGRNGRNAFMNGVCRVVNLFKGSTAPRSPVGRKIDARARRILVKAVADARKVAAEIQADISHVGKMSKSDSSPVTVADFAVQAIVAMGLKKAVGTVRLVGEENSDALRGSSPEARAMRRKVVDAVRRVKPFVSTKKVLDAIDSGGYREAKTEFWTLDPVDGTKGFLRSGHYSIQLARVRKGQPDFAVMGCPNLSREGGAAPSPVHDPGVIFVAEKGKGAVALPGDKPRGKQRAVSVSPIGSKLRMVSRVGGSGSSARKIAEIGERLGAEMELVKIDSATKYAVVAHGLGDAYIRAARTNKVWDHAAGVLLAREAGAVVTDFNGKQIDFSTGVYLSKNKGIVVAAPELHKKLLRAIDGKKTPLK